jgi:hypothetical protein
MPVQWIVGGVEIERDLRWRRRMGVEKQLDKQPLDDRCVIADLVIAGRLRPAQFQPVERRLAGQRRTIGAACFQLAAEHRHDRVVAQLVVVDQILIAQRNPEYPLTHQTRHLMDDQIGHTVIGEAAGKALDQPDLRSVAPSSIAPASEVIAPPSNAATTFRPSTGAKPNRSALHSVCIGTPPASETNRSCNTIFSDPGPRCTYPL